MAINKIADSGVQIEPASPKNFDFNEALSTYSALISLELYASLPLSREFLDGVSTLFQTEFYDRTQTAFKQGTPISRGGIRAVPPTLPKYAAILTERDRFIALMDAFINQWDAWICPVTISTAFTHRSYAQPIEVDSVKVPYLLACGAYTMIFNFTGHPVVVIPIGQTSAGLPIGMQIVGRRWQDFQVLAIAEKLSEIIGEFPHPPGY
jgi:amidase